MRKIFTLMAVPIVAGGVLLFGANSSLQGAEDEPDEAELHQEYTDMENIEKYIDEEEQLEHAEEEGNILDEEEISIQDEEERDYPDERYEDDRG